MILLFAMILGSGISMAQNPENTDRYLSFENISMKEGLSNVQVTAFCQDELGYIWIGTENGLNRFDGNQFKQYFFSAGDETKLSDNSIWALHAWGKGVIIESAKGLHYFDLQTESMKQIGNFLNYFHLDNTCVWQEKFYNVKLDSTLSYFLEEEQDFRPVPNFPDSLAIGSVYSDSIHGIWCTEELKNQLVLFHPGSGSVEFFDVFGNSTEGLVSEIQEIKLISGLLWIGSSKGLEIYDPWKRAGSDNPALEKLLSVLHGKDIRFIEVLQNEIWIGTLNHGLYIYNIDNQNYNHIYIEDDFGFPAGSLISAFVDRAGNVWIGTWEKGLYVQYYNKKKFNPNPKLNASVKGRFISCITADNSGVIYCGTTQHGLIQFDTKTSLTAYYSTSNSNLHDNNINSLLWDSQGKLWVGHRDGNVQIFNPQTRIFELLEFSDHFYGALTIAEFKGRIYVGGGGIISVYDLQGKLLQELTEIGLNIRQISVYNDESLLICSHGESYLGTGISIFNPESGILHKIEPSEPFDPPESWTEHYFITTFLDAEGILWIGNFKWGLFRYDFEKNSFKVFTKEDGLPSDYVIGITEDDAGNLWLSTYYGLSCFDKSETFRNYFYEEGINNQQFYQKSIYKHGDGVIYIGGNEGITYFKPEDILSAPRKAPDLVLNSLQINYENVIPGDDHQVLEKSLPYTSSVTLSHKQRSLGIDYVGFSYGLAHKIEYAVMLEGFDEEWRGVGNVTRAVYSNLSPGSYVFRVKARTSEENWSKALSLQLRVKQTPWLRAWALAIYTLVLIAVIVIVFRLQLKAKLYQKDLEIEQSERLRDEEINQMKLKFFTNISHELRTPLTVISAMVYMIRSQYKPEGNSKTLFESLRLNVDRMLRLIDQIMVFRKLENDALELQVQELPLKHVLQEVHKGFVQFASMKKIHLISDEVGQMADRSFFYDFDKLEKILANLISNAFKHTPEQGTVSISAREVSLKDALAQYSDLDQSGFPLSEPGYIEISVTDTGSGIGETDLPTIFDRFKRADSNGEKLDYSGTGIGLDFTKRLILLHKGGIRVRSVINQGSVFSFALPLDKQVYTEENILYERPDHPDVIIKDDVQQGEDLIDRHKDPDKKKYKVAIIEDNQELRDLMVDVLSHKYHVVSANNGLAGFHLIEAEIPDLIISDVVMPEMDGLSLCSKVKGHDLLNHIYFILLSAKSEVQDRIEGMERGGDMYLNKPFHMEYLLAVVDAYFVRLKRISRGFDGSIASAADKEEEDPAYLEFIGKLTPIFEKEIEDEEFNVDFLASQMHMSRANFYRKFVSIMGVTPNTYILKYRMNKATELLEQSDYSISEISSMLGFSSSTYFSTLFKKEKGVSPSQYLKAGNS